MKKRLKVFFQNVWMLSDYQLRKRGRFHASMYFVVGSVFMLSPIVIMTVVKTKFHNIAEYRRSDADFLRSIDVNGTQYFNDIACGIEHSSKLIDMQAPLLSVVIFFFCLTSIYMGLAVSKLHKLIKEKEDFKIESK